VLRWIQTPAGGGRIRHSARYQLFGSDTRRKVTAQIGAVKVLPVSYLYNPKGEQVSFLAGESDSRKH